MTVPGSDPRHPYVFCADLTCSVSLFAEQEMVISSAEKEFLEVNQDKSLHHMFVRPNSPPFYLRAEKLVYPKVPHWIKLSWSSQPSVPAFREGGKEQISDHFIPVWDINEIIVVLQHEPCC